MKLWLNGAKISNEFNELNEIENKPKFKRSIFLQNAFINILSYITNVFYKPYWYKNYKKDDDLLLDEERADGLNTIQDNESESEYVEFFSLV